MILSSEIFSLRLLGRLGIVAMLSGPWVALAAQREVTADSMVEVEGRAEPWRYLLHLPAAYEATAERRWPLLFFLHGRSRRGRDLDLLRQYGPPQFLDDEPEFPFVVVSPQLPDGGWPPGDLLSLLDEVVDRYRIDPDRVCLTGASLGASGAWRFAAFAPDRFAALVPVCGYGELSAAKRLGHVPVWAFHGDADEIVSIEPHRALIEAIQREGGEARLTTIPGGTHGNIIVPVYDRPDLYEWLLARRRKAPGGEGEGE